MKYSLDIRKSNIPCHLDLEKEITLKKNGLFTFTVRVNSGNIVDFNVVEYVNVSTYQQFAQGQSTFTFHIRTGSETDSLRDNNHNSPA